MICSSKLLFHGARIAQSVYLWAAWQRQKEKITNIEIGWTCWPNTQGQSDRHTCRVDSSGVLLKPVLAFYPQKLALTSPTSGGRAVGLVRSRTQATEFCLFDLTYLSQSFCWQKHGSNNRPRTYSTSYTINWIALLQGVDYYCFKGFKRQQSDVSLII
jgi:hypothetical protein